MWTSAFSVHLLRKSAIISPTTNPSLSSSPSLSASPSPVACSAPPSAAILKQQYADHYEDSDDGIYSSLRCSDTRALFRLPEPQRFAELSSCREFLNMSNDVAALPIEDTPLLIDAFVFNGEIDHLIMRLHELQDVVARFVIVESTFTFTKRLKPLLLPRFHRLLAPWFHLIQYTVVDAIPCDVNATWPTEFFIRNALYRGVTDALDFLGVSHEQRAGILVAVSDVDEIPHVLDFFQARVCSPAWLPRAPLFFRTLMFHYRFRYKMAYNWPAGARVMPYGRLRGHYATSQNSHLLTTDGLRHHALSNAQFAAPVRGWHCSSCLTDKAVFRKLHSFSHQELVPPTIEHIHFCASQGCYMYGKGKERWDALNFSDPENAVFLPSAVRAFPECFSFYSSSAEDL